MPLTPYQQAISNLARSLGLKGAAESQVYQRPEFQQFITQYFGSIPLPAGVDPSQVISNSGSVLEYRDADGYVHRLERNLEGGSPTLGQARETSTNRPGLLPLPNQEAQTDLQNQLLAFLQERFAQPVPQPDISDYLAQIQQLANQLAGPPALAAIDPETQAYLDQIKAAQNAQLQQQFQTQSGKLLAQLYGQGTNQSSIGNQALATLLQQQGLVQQQALSGQAQQALDIRQFLTQTGQGNTALALQGLAQGAGLNLNQFTAGQEANQQSLNAAIQSLNNFLGLQNQRDIASGGLGLDYQKLLESVRQFNVSSNLQAEQIRAAERANKKSLLSQIAGIAGAVAPFALAPFTGGASLLATPAIGAATGGSSNPYSSTPFGMG